MTTTEPAIAPTDTTETAEVDGIPSTIPRERAESPDDRLLAALGPEPTPDITIDANGGQREEDPASHAARVEAWREEWNVADLADADWAARKLRKVQARIGTIDQLEQDLIAKTREWAATERQKHASDVAYFTGRLEVYHRAQREQDPKHGKTIELPNGTTLKSQAGKLSVVVTDEAEAVGWLEEHAVACIVFPPAKILLPEVARRFGAKAKAESAPGEYPAVDGDGVVVPGVQIVRGDTSYSIS